MWCWRVCRHLRQHRLTGHSSRTHFIPFAGIVAAGASVQLPAHALWVGLIPVLGMFRTLICCPNCRNEISLEEARTTIPAVPLPEQSTTFKKASLVYTVCPKCRRDFRVTGERSAALAVLVAVFLSLVSGFFLDSWVPLAVVALLLLFQRKITQILIRAEHA